MAAYSMAPTEYSPPRELSRIALAMLGAAALVGLWRGFAETVAAQSVSGDEAAIRAVEPRVATALPTVSATTDTLIPPEAERAPATRTPAKPEAAPETPPTHAAPGPDASAPDAASAKPPTSSPAPPVTAPPPASSPERTADPLTGPATGPQPTLQVLDKSPVEVDDSRDEGEFPLIDEQYD
jgi:hypothetical protein